MEYQGTLLRKLDETSGVSQLRGTAWRMANYLLQENSTFQPRHIVISVFDGDVARIATWDAMIGKLVTATFDIKARERNGAWYNSVNGYGIREVRKEGNGNESRDQIAGHTEGGSGNGQQQAQPTQAVQPTQAQPKQPVQQQQAIDWESKGDGLPF